MPDQPTNDSSWAALRAQVPPANERFLKLTEALEDAGYQFHEFPGGPLLQHVRAHQPYHLGCVFAIVHK
jgi:hypothetical protein